MLMMRIFDGNVGDILLNDDSYDADVENDSDSAEFDK